MTYLAAMPGITARLQSIAGVGLVVAGEPSQVDAVPLIYYLFDRAETIAPGTLGGMQYVVMIRVLVPWKDNATSEQDIAPFVNSIPNAFDPKTKDGAGHSFAKLGGLVDAAWISAISSGERGGFWTIKGVPYRSIDFELTIKENKPNG